MIWNALDDPGLDQIRTENMATSLRKEIRLAVIGGGAKAIALAAKAKILRDAGRANIRVTVFEPHKIGAHWDGDHGYTDGEQRLCTPAERDLGFPYSGLFGDQVAVAMFQEFSWHSYLLSDTGEYLLWVDGARMPPTHKDFANYLRWAFDNAQCELVPQRVTALEREGRRWRVYARSDRFGARPQRFPQSFDGVVVTGPGPARTVAKGGNKKFLAERVFTGETFWSNLEHIKQLLHDPVNEQITVIGGGGTAAACIAWLARSGLGQKTITMVADQASLFSRGDSVFENRLFNDPAAWQSLSSQNRQEFFDRLNRGVVWNSVMEDLIAAPLTFEDGRATLIRAKPDEMTVFVKKTNRTLQITPAIVIDASGFDAWWFLSLLNIKGTRNPKRLMASITESLAIHSVGWKSPPLHVPNLSAKIGPGYGSLMSLGGMSDAVLRAYVHAEA